MLSTLKEKTEFLNRQKEKGFVNEESGASISTKENGNINIAASKYAQYRQNPEGKITELSLESSTVTNRKNITADEIVINRHKLNPDLYELTDARIVKDTVITELSMEASVLAKTFDKKRNRMVFIRRPARFPVFSPMLKSPEVPLEFSIPDITE